MKLISIDELIKGNCVEKKIELNDLIDKVFNMEWYSSDGNNVLISTKFEFIYFDNIDSNRYKVYSIIDGQSFYIGDFKKSELKMIGNILREYTDKRINVSVANCYL